MDTTRSLITDTDARILLALSRFHYLTTVQASRLLYPSLADDNRYMQRRLKSLVDRGCLLRLRRLPAPRYGQPPHVFTLARAGRRYLTRQGVPVPAYFRPAEELQAAWNDPFMTHRLAAVDVLVAAAALCRDYAVSCPRLLTERHLRHHPIRVAIASGSGQRAVAVIPDGWFQLRVGTQPPYSIALEVDRATEDQRACLRVLGRALRAAEIAPVVTVYPAPSTVEGEGAPGWSSAPYAASGQYSPVLAFGPFAYPDHEEKESDGKTVTLERSAGRNRQRPRR